ncbi:hypothetical protein TorRG33x02_121680 [Trema orientale]|uniref:Uncharacterized protein n=1 Tax=Trema orientale TaxID=63057 RepID=A0A2P5F2S5_TREOI|nr:hypothetical protein TorRG33x02_121680 [Trema orientale]
MACNPEWWIRGLADPSRSGLSVNFRLPRRARFEPRISQLRGASLTTLPISMVVERSFET